MEDKETHIWLDMPTVEKFYNNYLDTLEAIDRGERIINTTQTHFCRWSFGRKLFVHVNGEIHELTIGKCEGTDKNIREGHNMEKLLLGHHFSWY